MEKEFTPMLCSVLKAHSAFLDAAQHGPLCVLIFILLKLKVLNQSSYAPPFYLGTACHLCSKFAMPACAAARDPLHRPPDGHSCARSAEAGSTTVAATAVHRLPRKGSTAIAATA
jgi:hypothetical protein